MNGRALVVVAALALPAAAVAQENGRWFAGGGAGLSRLDGYELETLASDVDDEDIGWRAFAGRHFGRYFALGIGYLDFGTIEASGTLGTPALALTDRVAVNGVEVTAIGVWPITERIELYGTASYLRWDQDVTTTLGNQQVRASASDSSTGLGGGLHFWWRDDLAITFDARRYVEVGDSAVTEREHRRDLFTAGVTFRFGD